MSVGRETKASETNKGIDKNVSMPNRALTLKKYEVAYSQSNISHHDPRTWDQVVQHTHSKVEAIIISLRL